MQVDVRLGQEEQEQLMINFHFSNYSKMKARVVIGVGVTREKMPEEIVGDHYF